jgi:hypothetical protein
MKLMRIPIAVFFILSAVMLASAQKTEVTISLNEQFFDAALDAVFQHGGPLEFSIGQNSFGRTNEEATRDSLGFVRAAYKKELEPASFSASPPLGGSNKECTEAIKLLREANGVRTAVRFRDGRILAPLAFSGNYNPPFIGCVPFGGWAESAIDLEFDQNGQRLVARARVLNVSLNGTGGVGGSVIAKMVQSSIDKKINPIELFPLDKLSFPLPLKGADGLQMKATGIRHEIQNGVINIIVSYEFVKS